MQMVTKVHVATYTTQTTTVQLHINNIDAYIAVDFQAALFQMNGTFKIDVEVS